MRPAALACRTTGLRLIAWCLPAAVMTPALAEHLAWSEGRVTFGQGLLVGAENRLTGETYTAPGPSGLQTGLLHSRADALWCADATDCDGEASLGVFAFRAEWTGGARLLTQAKVDQATGDLIIRQQGTEPSGALHGCQWTLCGLSDEAVSIIVPAWSGVRLDRHAPVTDTVLDWPGAWEARMVIIQGRRGGLWIRADDPEDRFKGLAVRHRRGRFDLGFRTYNEGSPTGQASVDSVTWRLAFYEGDWRVPARQYRSWMAETFGLTPLEARRPQWAGGIRSVVILGSDRDPSQREEVRATLRKLTEWVTPSRCLLYIPGWRRDPYDINYPDYTAHEGYPDLVTFAHELGFRVMPHTCYYGVNLEHPAYEALKPYHMREALSGELITYLWPWSDPEPHIAMIHPGARAWRELYVGKCRDIVSKYGADALHLDVTLSMPNVTERADGLSTVQGNVAFHRDLQATLPETALGGEGLNEVSCRHECFAQTHGLLALVQPPGQPGRLHDPAGADCSHPISAYLLAPYTAWYGYLGYPPPAPSELYRGWTRAYESWGVLPTLSHPTSAELADPGPDLRARLEEMRLIDHYDMRPDFDAEASDGAKCVWLGRDGTRLVYEADGFGGSHAWFQAPSGEGRTVYRYVRGRTSVRGEGHIGGWPAYDQAGLYGLDPDRLHLMEPGAPDLGCPHVGRLPEDVVLRGFRCTDRFVLADFGLRRQVLDLTRNVSEAEVGINVRGVDQPLGRRAQFAPEYAVAGGRTRPALSVHPPWDPQPGVIGTVFAEWKVRIPQGDSRLEFAIGLRDGAEASDGVTFLVHVNGCEVFRRDWGRCAWRPCRVDLAAFAGQTVRLRLSVDKGPQGRGTFAWAAWGEPCLSSDARGLRFPLEVQTPGQTLRTPAKAPGALCFPLDRPAPAGLPLHLLQAPFSWAPLLHGVPLSDKDRPTYLGASVGSGECGGVAKPALAVHPPIGGATVVDYVLTLPANAPAVLTTYAGLQDGADRSNGLDFAVAVNGEVLHRLPVERPDGWHPIEVGLSRWVGQTIVLSLIADARGDAVCDWARWGEPTVQAC